MTAPAPLLKISDLIDHLEQLQPFERQGAVYVKTVGGGIKHLTKDHLYLDDFGNLIIL